VRVGDALQKKNLPRKAAGCYHSECRPGIKKIRARRIVREEKFHNSDPLKVSLKTIGVGKGKGGGKERIKLRRKGLRESSFRKERKAL